MKKGVNKMNKEIIQTQLKKYISNTNIIRKLRAEKKEGYKSLVNMYQWVLNLSASLLKDYKDKDEKLFFETVKEFNFIDQLQDANSYNVSQNNKIKKGNKYV
jgi:hypothetical protein